jgi:hypothetical protein
MDTAISSTKRFGMILNILGIAHRVALKKTLPTVFSRLNDCLSVFDWCVTNCGNNKNQMKNLFESSKGVMLLMRRCGFSNGSLFFRGIDL